MILGVSGLSQGCGESYVKLISSVKILDCLSRCLSLAHCCSSGSVLVMINNDVYSADYGLFYKVCHVGHFSVP